MNETSIDVAVIGSGVVGAAVAERLSARNLSCFILDRRPRTGGETTERNSGVIHAGLYYPASSKKTELTIRGNRALYAWAEKHGVPHRRCGKLIVAVDERDEAELAKMREHAAICGVEGLE